MAAKQTACLQQGLHLFQAGCQRPHCMVLCMGLSGSREGAADGREGDVRGQKLHAGRSRKTLQRTRYSLGRKDNAQRLDNCVLPGHAETQRLCPTRHWSCSSFGVVVSPPLQLLAPAQPLQPVWESTAAAWPAQVLGVLAATPSLHRSSHSPTAAAAAAPGLYPASASGSQSSWWLQSWVSLQVMQTIW